MTIHHDTTSPDPRRTGPHDPDLLPDPVDTLHQLRAHQLKEALRAAGIDCEIHWDRSPWGVRIPLVPGPYRDPTQDQPSLFALTERRVNISGQWAWEWDLVLGNFGDYDTHRLGDLTSHILERTWQGDDPTTTARILKDYVTLLTAGAHIAIGQDTDDQNDEEGDQA